MTILIYDALQDLAGVPPKLKSPALADHYKQPANYSLNLSALKSEVNAVGLAASGAKTITLKQGSKTQQIAYNGAGLYLIDKLQAKPLIVDIRDGKNQVVPIQRLALGRGLNLGISKMREPGWNSSTEARRTLGGQVIAGLGGYAFRTLSCEVKYRLDAVFLAELQKAYPRQIARGFPFFLCFSEANLPFKLLYAQGPLEYLMQNATLWKLYSMKFEFREAF